MNEPSRDFTFPKNEGVLGALYELANFWRKVAKVHPLYTCFAEKE